MRYILLTMLGLGSREYILLKLHIRLAGCIHYEPAKPVKELVTLVPSKSRL